MKWFQLKEYSAGKKRLILSWYLYKIFGKNVLYLIAFFVSFFTFLFNSNLRFYSKKYLEIIKYEANIKPSLLNQFRHVKSYANALVDKMLVYSGNFDAKDIIFDDKNDEKQLYEDINKNKGVVFIFPHIGNVEVLHSLFLNNINNPDLKINIFLSRKQSQIFNNFLKTIKIDFPVKQLMIEDIGVSTGIELKDSLNKGEIVFIAGDRLSENNDNKNIEAKIFSHKIFLPKGTFKIAKIMEVPTYLISVLKENNKYRVYLNKTEVVSETQLAKAFVYFMKKIILKSPFQFYHFYDFFA